MAKRLVLFGTLLCLLLVEISGSSLKKTPPLQSVTFTWKNGADGIWEDPDNWIPRGYPRTGLHDALICAPGSYKISHTQFLVAGSITLCDDPNVEATLQLDSSIGYVTGDAKTYVPPRFALEGAIIGKPLRIELSHFHRTFFDDPLFVNVTNLSTNDQWVVELNQTSIYGIYEGFFPTYCTLDSEDLPQTDPPTFGVGPFDVLEASIWANETLWTNYITMSYVDTYQEMIGLDRVTKTLFQRAIEKNLNGMLKLREKLEFILANQPEYEQNQCCGDESYNYPLQLFSIAQASYTFLRGKDTDGNYGCTHICDFCSQMDIQFDEGIGEVTFRWTGLGETNSWNDPRNWWPARVPNSPNAVVHLWSTNPEYVHLESDVRVLNIYIRGEIKVFNGPYILEVVRNTAPRTARRIWYGHGGSWGKASNWVPSGLPTDQEIAVLAGFGSVDLDYPTTIKDLLNIGAQTGGDFMGVSGPLTQTEPRPDQFGGAGLDYLDPTQFQP